MRYNRSTEPRRPKSELGEALAKSKQLPKELEYNQVPCWNIIDHHCPDLAQFEELYKDLHRHPELGLQESRTASIVAKRFRKLDLIVKTKIGGHGLVGVLENGPGPTILIRGELDALPVREETGLPYASKFCQESHRGVHVPVMHACGHDLHIACLLAVMTLLKSAISKWSGTVLCLFQPDEESGNGAQAMINDGLYDKIPVPDFILFQHVDHQKAGTVSIRSGPTQASADSFDVRIFGRGGHGAQPEGCIDPVLIGSYVIVRLQSIISRIVAPSEMAVLTCGSFHAGETPNTIPDHADLQINIRTYDLMVRQKIIYTMKQIIKAECEASGVEREPTITATSSFPLTVNNDELVRTLESTWKGIFGDRLHDQDRKAASEDLPNLATPQNIPYAVWFLGGTDSATWDNAMALGKPESIPRNHSNIFAPVIQPTLRTGVEAMASAVLSLVGKKAAI
ncbi:hypothetical protein MMC14_008349 [Varicellaria rhodocarpa]|nr:hypothetical protein [Varicellaria rhodocarpa]